MPSTRLKNLAYRMLLPVRSPAPDADPVTGIIGQPVTGRKELTRILKTQRVSGGALLLSGCGRESIVLSGCVKTNQFAAENSFFRVASITKMATALVALRLCEEHLIDPAAPVTSYLPDGEKAKDLDGVTLFHLLSHTSGLADPPGLERMLEKGAPYHEAVRGTRFSEPGHVFRYSNLGFGLVGCLLESVSGCPLNKLFTDKLFQPLRMNATLEGCSLPEDKIMPVVRLMPYNPDARLTVTALGRIPLSEPDPLHHFGHTAGSMYTDIRSLSRLLACIRDGGSPVLSSSMAAMMKQQHAVYGKISPTLSYGLGLLIIRDYRLSPSRILGHQGFAYGCADGAFYEENTGNMMIMLNGGCSEARTGRLGLCNYKLLHWAFRKEIPAWNGFIPS